MINKLKTFSVILFVSLLYSSILGMFFHSASNVSVLSTDVTDSVSLPIVMYHSVLKDTELSGKYVITPNTLVQDIEYLRNNGYTFISADELINFVDNAGELPEKPVMLTFDDGFYNNYGYVKPILEKFGAKAIISVVGSYTDEYSESNITNMTYGYMRWAEIYDMFLSSRIEIANHSYDFHSNTNGRNGSKRNKNEDIETYKSVFYEDTKKAQDRFLTKTGFVPIIYTYPFGAYSEETTDILKDMGFRMSLTCNEGMNYITKEPDSLFLLKRYNRPSDICTDEFFSNMLSEE